MAVWLPGVFTAYDCNGTQQDFVLLCWDRWSGLFCTQAPLHISGAEMHQCSNVYHLSLGQKGLPGCDVQPGASLCRVLCCVRRGWVMKATCLVSTLPESETMRFALWHLVCALQLVWLAGHGEARVPVS